MSTNQLHPRLARERQTIEKMASIYCREQHGTAKGALCRDCQELIAYSLERLRRCPFQERKSTCANCTVHCYRADMRERVRIMMRYAGPRMLLHHPLLAILHLLDGRRKAPTLPQRSAER